MNLRLKVCHRLAALFLLAALSAPGTAAPEAGKRLAAGIDRLLSAVYKPGEPGAAVIVRRNGRTLFRGGYGLANLELGVPVAPDMVFRLGSITKQFTAAAILLLAESGRLSLEDDIGRFLPGFPTGGRRVTVAHLLAHTSGIRSYTDMAEWLQLWRKDMTPYEIIAMSQDKPFAFAPGERWSYNNTGYVMLGAIIEKASGRSYEHFLQENVFGPLGMANSGYDHSERVIPRRVAGYHPGDRGFINAPYLSMTQPFAAGALYSSVDDLALWNDAILSGRLLKKESLHRAFTPFLMNDGQSTGYGCGWFLGGLRGHRTIEHGGGINGFTSYAISLPDDGIYVAVLTNCVDAAHAPEPQAVRIAELVLGLGPEERRPVGLTGGQLDALAGVYVNGAGEERYLTREGERLFSQRAGGARHPLLAASADELFFPEAPTVIRVTRDAGGGVAGLRVQARYGPAEIYRRSETPLPAARKEIALALEILERLAGEYEIQPGFAIRVSVEQGRLMGQATGQPKLELFAESETRFFLKAVDAQIVFDAGSDGGVTGLTLFQGGQRLPARKVR